MAEIKLEFPAVKRKESVGYPTGYRIMPKARMRLNSVTVFTDERNADAPIRKIFVYRNGQIIAESELSDRVAKFNIILEPNEEIIIEESAGAPWGLILSGSFASGTYPIDTEFITILSGSRNGSECCFQEEVGFSLESMIFAIPPEEVIPPVQMKMNLIPLIVTGLIGLGWLIWKRK